MLAKFKQKRVYSDVSEAQKKEYIRDKAFFGTTGGVVTTKPSIELTDDQLSYAKNIMIVDNKITKRMGYEPFCLGLPLPDPIMAIKEFRDYQRNSYLIVFTTKTIYLYDPTTKYFNIIDTHYLLRGTTTGFTWTTPAHVTMSIDDTFNFGGVTGAAKFVMDVDFNGGNIGWRNETAGNFSTCTHVRLFIKSSISLSSADLRIVFDDTDSMASPLSCYCAIPSLAANVTKEIIVAISNPAVLTAVKSVGLYAVNDKNVEYTVWIANIDAFTALTGTNEDSFSLETMYDNGSNELKFLMSNGVDHLRYWNGSGLWIPKSGTQLTGKYLKNFYNYLFLLNCDSGEAVKHPQKLQWTVNGLVDDWAGAGSGNNSIASSQGEIIGAEILQGQLVIFLEDRIIIMNITTDVYPDTVIPIPFNFSEAKSFKGCCANGSIQVIDDTIIYLGWDNLYIFDGFQSTPVGDDIKYPFIDLINREYLKKIHSYIIEEYNLYLLFYVEVGNTDTESCLVFDYRRKIFLGWWDFDSIITALGTLSSTYHDTTYDKATDDMFISRWYQKIKDANLVFSSTTTNNAVIDILMGDSMGHIWTLKKSIVNDNDVAINSYFDTKEYALSMAKFIRVVSLFLYGLGTSIAISTSNDGGLNFTSKDTIIPSAIESIDSKSNKIDTTGKSIMFRFANNAIDGWFRITGWLFRYIKKDREV